MKRPLAIDLFCGSFQTKFDWRTNASIDQFMTGWTQYPHHVRLGVRDQSPRAISFELWAVRDFKDAVLSAGLTRLWHILISSPQSIQRNVFELSLGFIKRAAAFILSSCPRSPQFSGGFNGAPIGAVPPIGVWRHYRKMTATPETVPTIFGRSFVLKPSYPSGALGAIITAPFFVWANGPKGLITLPAKQIVHYCEIAS